MRDRVASDVARLDRLLDRAGLAAVGATSLFLDGVSSAAVSDHIRRGPKPMRMAVARLRAACWPA
jgi:hypothetical protein